MPIHTQRAILWSGQGQCYDEEGNTIPCLETGQDGEYRTGLAWPDPRFTPLDENLVVDELTGLIWLRNANSFDFPMQWHEAQEEIAAMREENAYGRSDWRMPTRHELRSLVDHDAKKPALPAGHPFRNIFLGWYWTSTDAAIAEGYAWRLQIEGGRLFFGNKEEESFLWPVAGESRLPLSLSRTDLQGKRFQTAKDGAGILDTYTGLIWHDQIDPLPQHPLDWQTALQVVASLREKSGFAWRLPAINELESLVDVTRHSPALGFGHPFTTWHEGYWSSTTSFYEPSWSYVLYLHKGAVGVGFKKNRDFHLWPVRGSVASVA